MSLLLILEDNASDLRRAADLAKKAGFDRLEVRVSAATAVAYLDDALASSTPMPDAMLIDLDLGVESGFEVIRKRYISSALRLVPTVVWTGLLHREREFCRLFAVNHFVGKDEGDAALVAALASVLSESSPA